MQSGDNCSALSRRARSGKISTVLHRLPRCTVFALVLIGCGSDPITGHAPYWRINTTAGSSTLLGTIHGGVNPDELPDDLWQRVAAARVVITETDTRTIDSGDFTSAVTLPPGETLEDYTTTEEWRTLLGSDLVDSYRGPMLARLQPWYLQGILVSSLIPEYPPVDVAVVEAGRDAGVSLVFLEHWREQVDMLNGLGVEDGLEQLLMVADDPEQAREIFDDWISAYQAGNGRWLTELTMHPDAVLHRPRYYNDIVFGRNHTWLTAIERELDAGNAFVAVGFAHMFSDAGLVALLRARGYDISKVAPP